MITLAIIGVIASMTIPALITSLQKDQYVEQLKKVYSVLSGAVNELRYENGGSVDNIAGFGSTTSDHSEDRAALNMLSTKLISLKICESDMGCLPSKVKFLGGGPFSADLDRTWNIGFGKAIMSDGTMIMLNIYGTSSCGWSVGSGPLSNAVCGEIWVDINGLSKPNQIGRDIFKFWIAKTGIYPFGANHDSYSCDINNDKNDPSEGTSDGCTAKVLKENAMNY